MMHGLAFPLIRPAPSALEGRTVLQIIPALEAGGTEQIAIEVAAALTDAGARALVATTGGELVSELQARGGIWVPFPADSRNPLAMANNVRKLRDLIRTERPSLIHAHSRAAAWVALGAAQLTGTPLITTYHGTPSPRHAVSQHYDSVMARGDLVLAYSDFAGNLVASGFPAARDRLRVIPLGVDLRDFSPSAVDVARVEALRTAWGVPPHRRIVLLPVRPAVATGHAVLIRAAQLLRAQGLADSMVMLPGEPDERSQGAELDRMIAEGGLADHVRRAGPCDDRAAALMAASLVVLPATQPDLIDLAALEAQAMGTPVVMSDHGAVTKPILAPPDVLPTQRTGWFVRPGQVDELAEAIGAGLSLGASARDALARRARAHVEREFSRDRMVEATLDAYVALIEGQQPRSARARAR